MGYYTSYYLECDNPEAFMHAKKEFGLSKLEDENKLYLNCKWYDHEYDIKVFSVKHPDALFILTGYGEEEGDIWCKYFKNGKMQEAFAELKFDEFDENKLV